MQDAVIVSAVRTAVGKAPRGRLSQVRPDEMGAVVIAEALKRAGAMDPALVDDVIMGCAMPEAEQGLNVARIASLRAGVPVEASAVTVNRFCSSGLQAIAYGAERIMLGHAQAVVAGGTESMSLVPMGGNKVSPNPALVDSYPDVYLTTGLVAENHARTSRRSRARRRTSSPSQPPAGDRRGGRRALRRGDRADDDSRRRDERRRCHPAGPHGPVDQGRRVRHRRGAPARHLGSRAGRPQAGLPRSQAPSPPAIPRRPATAPRPSS